MDIISTEREEEAKKIITELDGGQHNEPGHIEYDTNRNAHLESLGYKVLRIWNNEVDNNIEGVYLKLKEFFGIND